MFYLLGADEAGYGPNLGPLVVSATLWKVDSRPADDDLYQTLAEVITADPREAKSDDRVAIADSKALYKPRGTLRLLERGLLPILSQLNRSVDDWAGLWNALEADPQNARAALPWYQDYQLDLPIDFLPEECEAMSKRLADCFDSTGARPLAIRSRAVFPAEFNDLVEEQGTKGAVLSRITLGLVADLLKSVSAKAADGTKSHSPDAPALVVCDKHGGRNRYGELLQSAFPDTLIEVHHESRAQSVYRWGERAARVEARFQVGGESFLPTALASMASKYLREIAMRAFNQYWIERLPKLKPTAGYPVDALRFYEEIAPSLDQLNIPKRTLWRAR